MPTEQGPSSPLPAWGLICYRCGWRIQVTEAHFGKLGQCSNCNAPIPVPNPGPVTDRQREYLIELGANPAVIDSLTKRQASMMIDVLVALRDGPEAPLETLPRAAPRRSAGETLNGLKRAALEAPFTCGCLGLICALGCLLGVGMIVSSVSTTTGHRSAPVTHRSTTTLSQTRAPVAETSASPAWVEEQHSGMLSPADLQVGRSYRYAQTFNLMPEFEPSDPIHAISRVVKMPPDSSFYIREKRIKGSTPWYLVGAIDGETNKRYAGWVNSSALFSRKLEDITQIE